ncbi:MAG: hypothetical protein OEV80_17150, partial [candidate division Zixibacteria bacterium]|nr:hypothetical protein [candidate division Zixibacteria bacterium]
KNILKDLPLIFTLRKKRYDIVFDPICHDSVTGLLLSRLISNGAIRAAARKLDLMSFYDYCEPFQPEGEEHNIDNNLLVFNLFGVAPETVDPFMPVYLPEDCQTKAAAFVQTLSEDRTFRVGINISAGSPTRNLALSKFSALIDGIIAEHAGVQCVIVCTSGDRERGRQLVENREGKAYLVPQGLSLLEAAAIIEKFDLFVSPDTSLIHMARLMRVPVVGLYSGHLRNYHFWKPYRQEHGSVVSSHPGHLHDIEVSRILEEVDKLLKSVYPDGTARITPSR